MARMVGDRAFFAVVWILFVLTSCQSIGLADEAVFPGAFLAGPVGELVEEDSHLQFDGGDSWVNTQIVPGAFSLRLQLTSSGPEALTQDIMILDEANRVAEIIAAASLRDRDNIWTRSVSGSSITVKVMAPSGTRPNLKVKALMAQTNTFAPESVVGENELQDVSAYDGENASLIASVAAAVGKIEYLKGNVGYTCTGFAIGKGRILTNEHCINVQEICDTAVFTAGYQLEVDGRLSAGSASRCEKVLYSNYDLDVAMIKLEAGANDDLQALPLASVSEIGPQPTFVIQHPGGDPKKVSVINCSLTGQLVRGRRGDSDHAHTCDTASGSSGSPVIDMSGKVIALHHLGRSKRPPFTEVNRAVNIEKVVDALASAGIEY